MARVVCACEGTDSRDEKMSTTFGKDEKREGVGKDALRMRSGEKKTKQKPR